MPILSGPQLVQLAINAGFPTDVAPTMAAIALAESSGNSDAVSPPNRNGSRDRGLWQINDRAWAPLFNDFRWQDPQQNASMAFIVYTRQGITAWSVYNSGRYRMFLNRVGGSTDGGTVNPGGTGGGNTPPPSGAGSGGVASDFDIWDGGTWARLGLFILGGALVGLSLYNISKGAV